MTKIQFDTDFEKNVQLLLDRVLKFKTQLDKTAFLPEEKKILFELFAENAICGKLELSHASTSAPTVVATKKDEIPKTIIPQETSFAGLVRKTKFKSHTDLVLLATYYIMEVLKSKESVKSDDIESMYSKALLQKSSNTSQMINENRKKGLMMDSEKEGGVMTFKITMAGIDFINEKIKNGN